MYRLRVKEIAEAQGYNMSSLSRKTDISFLTIKRVWRNPQYGISIVALHKIAQALGVRTGDLIEDLPDEEVPQQQN